MTTIPHEPARLVQERPRRPTELLVPEVWASLAIGVMWLAVLVDAVFGPDIVSNGVAGDSTRVPSAIVVAVCAFLATWVVARYGFSRERRD